jgi:hypothetical protein
MIIPAATCTVIVRHLWIILDLYQEALANKAITPKHQALLEKAAAEVESTIALLLS